MPLGHYLILSGLLFAIGASGVFLRAESASAFLPPFIDVLTAPPVPGSAAAHAPPGEPT